MTAFLRYDLEPHPLALAFPAATEARVAELERSVRRVGLLIPIVVLAGRVLDGRGRLEACRRAAHPLTLVEHDGADPVGFLLAVNLPRLTTSQRGLLAVEHADALGECTPGRTLRTAQRLADLVGVGRETVERARRLRARAPAATLDDVRAGRLTLKDAVRRLEG